MRFEHDDQEEFPYFTIRPVTLSARQIKHRLADLRSRLRSVTKPETRERILADYIGFSARDR